MKKISCAILLLLIVLAACSLPEDDIKAPEKSTLGFKEDRMTLFIGDVVKLFLIQDDEHELTFSSSNESIVTVSTEGIVKAVSEGSALITSKMGDMTAVLNITVITPENTRIEVDLNEFANEVIIFTNIERERIGLHPLEHDEILEKVAQTRALEITDTFSHTRPDGTHFSTAFYEAGIEFINWGENIGYRQKTPTEVVNGWMDSKLHRDTILNPDYSYTGVGIHINSTGLLFWVQTFKG